MAFNSADTIEAMTGWMLLLGAMIQKFSQSSDLEELSTNSMARPDKVSEIFPLPC
jgi:hypothetical protein